MSTEESKDKLSSAIEAATGLVKAIPIYDDAIQPAAKQVGKSLETIGKVVNIALLPLSGMVWGFERVGAWLNPKLAEKLENVSEENITTPNPQVAGPAIEALRFVAEDEQLRELYANLLASAMNKETLHKAHPGYVDIIKNMNTDEALLLKVFIATSIHPLIDIKGASKIQAEGAIDILRFHSHLEKAQQLSRPDLIPSYLDNLCRLGLVELPMGIFLSDESRYTPLEQDQTATNIKNLIATMDRTPQIERRIVKLTSYGKQFVDNVVNFTTKPTT